MKLSTGRIISTRALLQPVLSICCRRLRSYTHGAVIRRARGFMDPRHDNRVPDTGIALTRTHSWSVISCRISFSISRGQGSSIIHPGWLPRCRRDYRCQLRNHFVRSCFSGNVDEWNGGTTTVEMLLRFTYGIGRVSVDLESLSLGTPSVAMNNFRWNVCNVARLEDPPPSFDSVLLRSRATIPHPRPRNEAHSAGFRTWFELKKTSVILLLNYFPDSSVCFIS